MSDCRCVRLFFSRVIVRWFKLDRRWKTLRYKNQWYYVFSGEVFEFDKFKRATKTLAKIGRKAKEVQLARADILIKGAEGGELYTGYVADYDLNPADISKLDNIYLLDAIRYKTSESGILSFNKQYLKIDKKKMIPGELFVLSMANMVNINVSYLLAPIKGETRIKGQINSRISFFIKLLCFVVFLPSAFFIFYNPDWLDWFCFSEVKWYLKVPLFSLYANLVAAIFPRYNIDKKVYFYKWKDLLIIISISLGLIVYYFLMRSYLTIG